MTNLFAIYSSQSARHALLITVMGFLATVALAGPACAETILRHATQPMGERVEVLSGRTGLPAVFTLSAPDRLIMDLPADGVGAGVRVEPPLPAPFGEVRWGLFAADRMRIVIPLSEPLVVSLVTPIRVEGRAGVAIDLVPATRSAFDRQSGAPERARWVPGATETSRPVTDDRLHVVVDPGHGGIDPGAQVDGITEKSYVLGFSRRLAAMAREDPAFSTLFSVTLTRDRDIFVPLAQRVLIARETGADILISLHADTLAEGRAEGMSAYTLSEEGTDAAAAAFALRENRSDLIAGADLSGESDDLTRLLIDLAQRGTVALSRRAADLILSSLERETDLLETRPHRVANFRVLKAPDVPSVLIELGFLDSAADLERMQDPDWQDRIARAILRGIADWDARRP